MKKVLVLFICCLFLSINSAFAKDVDRKLIMNAKIKDVQVIVKDVIDLYKGVITVKTFDEKESKYVVEYNGATLTAELGIDKNTNHTHPKAMFSCQLEPKGENVLMTVRKVRYSGWFGSKMVFNHYKKLYQELEYNGYVLSEIK